jgi:molybdate transport system substrate-binding protein
MTGTSRRRTLPGALVLMGVLLSSPVRADAPRVLTVAAAANLKPALDPIVTLYRDRNPGVDVRITYGASGTFFAQIQARAPLDLFLSADAEYPAAVAGKGLSDGKPFTYAFGKLAVWTPAGVSLDLAHRGLAALLDPSVKKIAIGNPAVAPYGRAARAALEQAGLLAALKDRLVLGQSVGQAAQFAQTGAAQAAILPASLVRVPPLSMQGRAWVLPPGSHPVVEQAGVVLKGASQPALARDFAAFLVSEEARRTFARLGYTLPPR